MSVMGIGVSSGAWDYWELLRRSEARQNASLAPSAMDAVQPIGEEQDKSATPLLQETPPVIPPERRNLFAEQLAATILEQEKGEEGDGAATVANPFTTALDESTNSSSGSPGSKIAIKSVTDGGARYIVGVRTDGNGDEAEVFRIPQDASARKSPLKESQEFLEMELLSNSSKETTEKESCIGTAAKKISSALIKQAQNAYGMYSSLRDIYNVAA